MGGLKAAPWLNGGHTVTHCLASTLCVGLSEVLAVDLPT